MLFRSLCNELSSAFGDLAGTLDRAYPRILAGSSGTFADVLGRSSRMQCHQITGPLADALGGFACALPGSFANVTGATADIAASASSLGWGCGLRMARLSLCGGGLRLGRILAVNGESKSQRRQNQQQQCDRSFLDILPFPKGRGFLP